MSQPTLAPVDDYPVKDNDVRSEEETIAAEGREGAVDQIPDYTEQHPTLDTSGPEHDPEVQQALRDQAAGVAVPVAPQPPARVVPPQSNPDPAAIDQGDN
jgi:hypothetical protein